jgi:hypothetical protein
LCDQIKKGERDRTCGCIREVRITYKNLVGKSERKKIVGEGDLDGKAILK